MGKDKLLGHILGNYVVAYRKEHGESITQFAKGCGLSVSTIRRLERGLVNPSTVVVMEVSEYIGLTLVELWSEYVRQRHEELPEYKDGKFVLNQNKELIYFITVEFPHF